MKSKYKYVQIGVKYDYTSFICKEKKACNDCFCYSMDLHTKLNPFFKFFFHIHTSRKIRKFIKLPFKKIWARFVLDKEVKEALNPQDNICFIYQGGETYFDIEVFQYLKNKYPNAVLVYLYNDLVLLMDNLYPGFLQKVKDQFDFVMSYNQIDCVDYNLILTPPMVLDYHFVDYKKDQTSDVFFIGREKGRLNTIIEIYDICTANGLKCFFYLVDVPIEKQIYRENVFYGPSIDYLTMLTYVRSSKSVLNIVQSGAQGITMRDYEAIGMNKVLITNNDYIKNTDLYTQEKVVFTDMLKYEIYKISKQDDDLLWNNKENYSIDKYFDWLDKTLESGR